MHDDQKIDLFERASIPSAVAKLSIPMILSSLVMVLYNMADTYFVGMLNQPVENAAVSLAAPVLLAFNAVNNLFGVGTSSMMSRALGRKDYEVVSLSSAFGFYCSLICGVLFGILCCLLQNPLLSLIGADATTKSATQGYLFWTVFLGAAPAILNVVMAYLVRSEGSALHASIGTMSGCFLNMILDPIFILFFGLGVPGAASLHPEFAQRNRDDNSQQFHLRVRRRRSSCYGNLLQNLHGANAGVHGILSGDHAVSQLQFCLRGSKTHESVDSLCY